MGEQGEQLFGRGLEDALELQRQFNEINNICFQYLQQAFAREIEHCPDCGAEMAIVPIDDDRGMVYDECECGTQSEPYLIFKDPLSASLVLDDILDAEFVG